MICKGHWLQEGAEKRIHVNQSKRASLSIYLQFNDTYFTDPLLKNFINQVIHFSHLGEQLIPFDLALCEPIYET